MKLRKWLFVGLVALTVFGCSGKKTVSFKTEPVTIKITHKGQPLEGADVRLHPLDTQGRGAMGKTDAAGVAVVKTFGDGLAMVDGAIAGKYKVLVNKVNVPQVDPNMDYEKLQQQRQSADPYASAPKPLLPLKYNLPDQSPFECEVKAGKNEFTFDIPE